MLSAVPLVACTTPGPKGRADLLDFLEDGRISRDAVYLKLGAPAREFDQGRIVSWYLARDESGYIVLAPAARLPFGARYELVVVFGADDVVQRHSVVEIRAS